MRGHFFLLAVFFSTDEGLTLETSASQSLYGGQFTLSTQLIKPNYLVILPPTQHHNFFRNLPPLRERGTTSSLKEVRNADWDSFFQTKNTPASGSLQKVLITVSIRKLVVQDMISKVFDQPAVDVSLRPYLYVSHISYFIFLGEGLRTVAGISQLSIKRLATF